MALVRQSMPKLRRLLPLLALVVSALSLCSAGLAEDKAAAHQAHLDRVDKMKNYHAPGGAKEQALASGHKGHHGHGGEHMHNLDNDTLHEYHDLHHHDQGSLPVKHRMPMGVQVQKWSSCVAFRIRCCWCVLSLVFFLLLSFLSSVGVGWDGR